MLLTHDSDCHKNGACNRLKIDPRLMERNTASVGQVQMLCSTDSIHVSGGIRAFETAVDNTRRDRASYPPQTYVTSLSQPYESEEVHT